MGSLGCLFHHWLCVLPHSALTKAFKWDSEHLYPLDKGDQELSLIIVVFLFLFPLKGTSWVPFLIPVLTGVACCY